MRSRPVHDPPIRSTWTRVGPWRLHALVADAPDRPGDTPLLLVHGLGVSSSYMRPLVRALAGTRPVLAPDLPGHGRSDAPARPLDIPELADALLGWMDAVGIGRAALLGNSMGCQIAADVAARRPERIERLVLVGPTLDPALRSIPNMLAHLVASATGERLAILPVLALEYARSGVRHSLAEMRIMRANDLLATLARVRAPCLVVRGERDRIADAAWCEAVARRVATRCTEVLGWGHALNFSAPDALAPLVDAFLRGAPPPTEPVSPPHRPVWRRLAAAAALGAALAIAGRACATRPAMRR